MATATPKAHLQRLVEELHELGGPPVVADDVAGTLEQVLTGIETRRARSELDFRRGLEGLAAYIRTTKFEIAALRPDEVKERFLPAAADELDAIVDATAEATHAIMDAAEAIEAVAAGLDDGTRGTVESATTRIYEACGFQDITGQRVTKVVGALQEIEAKINAMLIAFGSKIERERKSQPARKVKNGRPTDEELLAGPQKTGEANSQDDIDKLLAETD